jgi:hypothetical protein
MRKLFLTGGLLAVVAMLTYPMPRPAWAKQTCTATCQAGATITCTVASGTCTSSPGTVTCCGQVHNCNAINAYNACKSSCSTALSACFGRCNGVINPCVAECETAYRSCLTFCGSAPQTSFSC